MPSRGDKARRATPAHVEGYERAEWILLDYFDFIVHVFSGNARMFYGLERLWGAGERVDLPEEPRLAAGAAARPAPPTSTSQPGRPGTQAAHARLDLGRPRRPSAA